MKISSTKPHLTTARAACKPGDCAADDRKKCRQDIRDMVIESDNILVAGTLFQAGTLVAGMLTAGAVLGTLTGSAQTGLGIAGSLVGGVATTGLYMMKKSKDEKAVAKFNEAFQKADETGCYTRDELYQWYRKHVVG